jgi:hypothetical protein
MRPTLTLLTVLVVAALATAPAAAAHERGSGFNAAPSSIFPRPRDPWRSWGVRSQLPRRVGVPPSGPRAVWVPGQWVWDGATNAWLWWPGHWVR